MGWASCIEDVTERYDAACPLEAYSAHGDNNGGNSADTRPFPKPSPSPSGSGGITSRNNGSATVSGSSATGPAGRSRDDWDARRDSHSTLLAGYYHRLRTSLVNASRVLKNRFIEEQWADLSCQMDGLAEQVNRFDCTTLFAGNARLIEEANSIGNRIDSLMDRADGVHQFLRDSLLQTLAELTAIDNIKKQFRVTCSLRDFDTEKDALALVDSCRTLDSQIHALKQFAEERQMDLTDTWFRRYADNPMTHIEDKDRAIEGIESGRGTPRRSEGRRKRRKPR